MYKMIRKPGSAVNDTQCFKSTSTRVKGSGLKSCNVIGSSWFFYPLNCTWLQNIPSSSACKPSWYNGPVTLAVPFVVCSVKETKMTLNNSDSQQKCLICAFLLFFKPLYLASICGKYCWHKCPKSSAVTYLQISLDIKYFHEYPEGFSVIDL